MRRKHDPEMGGLLDEIFPADRGIKRRRQYRMPLWLGVAIPLACFVFGVAWGGGWSTKYDSEPPPLAAPTVTVTATETRTQAALPAACRRALDIMERVMADTSTIAGAGEKQLDLSHAARRAIFSKDWEALDKTMVEQTALNNALDAPSQKAMGRYAELAQEMKDCRDELK